MKSVNKAIRLIVADDHALLRKGMQHLFSCEEDLFLVTAVSNGKELVAAVKEHKPDVVITDLKMSGMDGPQACDQIQQESPETAIIVYSMYDSEDLVRRMRSIGVRGYLLKGGDGHDLCTAVRTVHRGGEYYCASIRQRTTQFFRMGKFGSGTGDKKEEFSNTELEIIKLICQEYCTKEIAGKLKIKERAVQSHKEHIEDKMDVRGLVGIAVYATRNWLLY